MSSKNKSNYFRIVIFFCFSIIFLFISCSPKAIPPKPTQQDVPKIETGITVADYLSLPIWEKEQEAFRLLVSASDVENIEELKLLYSDIIKLFEEINSNLGKLEVSLELEKINTLQLEISQLYIDSLNNFIEHENPIELEKLKIADQKMKDFVIEIEKVNQL